MRSHALSEHVHLLTPSFTLSESIMNIVQDSRIPFSAISTNRMKTYCLKRVLYDDAEDSSLIVLLTPLHFHFVL